MGIQTFLTTFLLFIAAYNVSAQFNGRVEFLAPPPGTISATSYIQPTGQFVVPAVIKPLIGPEVISQPPSVPSYPEYNHFNAPFMPHHMPMFMGGSRDDDDWHDLLYFLIFANMRNRWGNGYEYNGYGNSGGCGCGGCGNNGCGNSGCGNNGCGNSGCGCDGGCNNYGGDSGYSNGNGVTYIPYPIPVPINTGQFYNSFTSGNVDTPQFQISDDITYPGPTLQAYGGKDPNEITLMIRTESCN